MVGIMMKYGEKMMLPLHKLMKKDKVMLLALDFLVFLNKEFNWKRYRCKLKKKKTKMKDKLHK